jgi:hypothetical protein
MQCCAVLLQDFLINILLTLLGYIPGEALHTAAWHRRQQWLLHECINVFFLQQVARSMAT